MAKQQNPTGPRPQFPTKPGPQSPSQPRPSVPPGKADQPTRGIERPPKR